MAELSTSQVFGDLTVTGLTKTSVLQSLIGTGTAPLVIASTTLVNNLNADLLDGFHGAVDANADTYVLRGSSLANIQATGLSNSWGVTNGTATGGLNVVMGTGPAATWLISGTSNGVFRCGIQVADSGSGTRIYSGDFWLSIGSDGLITSSSGFSGSLTGNASTAAALQTARTIAISGDGVGTATSFNGSANITIPFTLANVATAGTYRSVTVNAKGLVTAGTNPTTLSGYGITDATSSSHVGTNGAAHAVVTTSVNGFMSATDKVNLDKVPLLGQGLRNSFLCDGGQLNWGTTANVFSWSKAYNIYPAQGTLLLNGLPFKKLTIAASSVTLPSAGQCAYITVPTAYSDAPNLVGTCTMAVADATTVSGTDKIILYVRDDDSCLQGLDGWIVYGTIVQAGGKRDAYVENLYTAASDFIVGVGSRTFAKKTLAETKTILGVNASTSSATGVVQLATSAEVTAGADAVKAVTPITLKVELDKKLDDSQLSTDGTMATNSTTLIPSQSAVITYVLAKIASLVNGSPTTLDTLKELATALGNDPNFATTITTLIGTKVAKADFTALNDILVGTGAGTYIKKTPSEVRTILNVADGANNYVHPDTHGQSIILDDLNHLLERTILVKAVTTSSTIPNTLASIDGYIPAAGDLILLASSAGHINDGVYTVAASGTTWTRATIHNTESLITDRLIKVLNGTIYKNSYFTCVNRGAITIGTTAIKMQQVYGDRTGAGLSMDNKGALSVALQGIISEMLASNLNLPGAPTAATASIGTDTNQIATTAYVNAMVGGTTATAKSLAANGYAKMANGLIMQWGSHASNTTITFPVAFPTACLQVISTANSTDAWGFSLVRDVSNTSFTIMRQRANGTIWFAIGN